MVSILSDYLSRIMSAPPIERQSMISLFSMVVLTFFGYLATFYFAHVLGPAILGGYFLFLAYYGIFDLIGDGGFGGAAIKRISEGKERNEFFSAFIVLRVILLCGAITLLTLAHPYLVDLSEAGLFLPLLIAIITGSFYSSMYAGNYGQGKIGINKAGDLLNFFAKIIVQVSAVFLGYGLGGLFGGFIAGMLTGGFLLFRFLNLRLTRFSRYHLASLLSFSFWIFLTAGGNLVFSISDVILIGYFMTNTDVGIYRTALQLTSVATFMTIVLQGVLYPRISEWGVKGELERIQNSLSRAFSYSLLLAIPVCIGGWALGDWLLFYLYGAAFQAGASALYILLLMQVINVFMYFHIMSLNALNRPRNSFQSTAIAATANIGLNIALIPLFGILGAALATSAAMGVNTWLSRRYLRRIITISLDQKTIVHILTAAIAMGVLVVVLRLLIPLTSAIPLGAIVVAGALAYFILLFRLNPGFYRDIRDMVRQFGGPWPHWLDFYFT